MYLMNCILFFIVLTEIFSSNPVKPKFCRDCKFFTKDFFDENKYGKCSLFPKVPEKDNIDFLVDGIKPTSKLYFCSVSRTFKDMCGPEGKFYEKK
jgi:hypothetical protein